MTNTSLETQTLDESVLEGLSPADLLADPFGIILQAMDTPGFVQQVLQTLATDLECQLLGLSAAEATYLAAYLQAIDPRPKTPALLRALFAAAAGTIEPLITRMVLVLLYEASPDVYSSMADPQLEKKARDLCYGRRRSGVRLSLTLSASTRWPMPSTGTAWPCYGRPPTSSLIAAVSQTPGKAKEPGGDRLSSCIGAGDR